MHTKNFPNYSNPQMTQKIWNDSMSIASTKRKEKEMSITSLKSTK